MRNESINNVPCSNDVVFVFMFNLAEYGNEFDYLFIQFYNNYCYPGDQYFLPVMDTWLKWARNITNGPLIVLGLPAAPEATGKSHYYFPPDKLAAVYKVLID